jgi:hypothetical protein
MAHLKAKQAGLPPQRSDDTSIRRGPIKSCIKRFAAPDPTGFPDLRGGHPGRRAWKGSRGFHGRPRQHRRCRRTRKAGMKARTAIGAD